MEVIKRGIDDTKLDANVERSPDRIASFDKPTF
jgi:hypothetical protein